MRASAAILLALLALASASGCSRRHAQQGASSQGSSNAAQSSAPAPQSSGGGLFSSCPPVPSNSRVAGAIKSALNQIYGADEGNVRVTVSAVTPGADCQTYTVRYSASSTAASAPLAYEAGQWSVLLFKKNYPVP
ncbi:MAG: hypothetical protein JO261_01605 [Alphaproteobacteria bacterium]|nr:hypothetical protein [Alphaproteobacteria bacterium]MBV9692373.1 hypothetical protein [Alphaproteobacteria bacterium]